MTHLKRYRWTGFLIASLLTLSACGGNNNRNTGPGSGPWATEAQRSDRSGDYTMLASTGGSGTLSLNLLKRANPKFENRIGPNFAFDMAFPTGSGNRSALAVRGDVLGDQRYLFRYLLNQASYISVPNDLLIGRLTPADANSLVIGAKRFVTDLGQVAGMYSVLSRVVDGGTTRGTVDRMEVKADGTLSIQRVSDGGQSVFPETGMSLTWNDALKAFTFTVNGGAAYAMYFVKQPVGGQVMLLRALDLGAGKLALGVGVPDSMAQPDTGAPRVWRGWDSIALSRQAWLGGGLMHVGKFKERVAPAPGISTLLKYRAANPLFAVPTADFFVSVQPASGYLMFGTRPTQATPDPNYRNAAPDYVVR